MLVCCAAIIIAAGLSTATFAAEKTGVANVLISSSLEISESAQMNFGTVENQNGSCAMDSSGNLSGICAGIGTPASFIISGAESQAVSISLSVPATVDTIEFSPSVVGSSSVQLINGTATINVVGTLNLNDTSPGARTIAYSFSANYQ